MVVIHRLHQILEPFMLRRQVQDVESRLPEKVRLRTIATLQQLARRFSAISQMQRRRKEVQVQVIRFRLAVLQATRFCDLQVAVVVKCAMTPYQSAIYNWVKV